MSEKSEIVIIVPDDAAEMSRGAVKLCEAFVYKIIASDSSTATVAIDENLRYVECRISEIKVLLSMYLGAGLIRDFYHQLIGLAHQTDCPDLYVLKVFLDGKRIEIGIMVCSELPNLEMQISKTEADVTYEL